MHATQRHFLQSLRSGLPFESEALDHLRCAEIIEAAYTSAATGQAITLS